ncbi:MAG: type II CRISPR RNA-guided endonuclease Cas9 [Parvularculales bacterium]
MDYRLGLDVGTNSLGWSVLEVGANGTPVAIKAAGSRIFSDGRDNQSKSTLAADRREARSSRRRHDRYKQRRTYLLKALTGVGLFPAETDGVARQALQKLNPLELRARLLSDKAGDILNDLKTRGDSASDALNAASGLKAVHLVGRALFHLNQRRGFQSNRKDRSEETTNGKVSGSVRLLMQEMTLIAPPLPQEEYKELSKEDKKAARQGEADARKNALEKLADQKDLTYGSFLYSRQQEGKQTRARPGAGDNGKLYDVYPNREVYKDEFNKIWGAQSEHFSNEMRDKALFHKIIFTQRPLKPQKLGKCTYMPAHDRTFRAMPSFQRYRMYQEVNSLGWNNDQGYFQNAPDCSRLWEARDAIVTLLERVETKNGQIVWSKMKNILKRMDIEEGNFEFNFESEKRKGFDGNLTSNIMQREDYVGSEWHEWSLEKQDNFIDIIINGTPEQQKRDKESEEAHKSGKSISAAKSIRDGSQDDKDIADYLVEHFNLPKHSAENCVNATLQDGTAHISKEAACLMLEKMRGGIEKHDEETGEVKTVIPLQHEAAENCTQEIEGFVTFTRKMGDDGKYEPRNSLPYYGEAFHDGRHIIPGNRKPEDEGNDLKYYGGITNPTVHIALNQIRQVVNELITRFGHPHSIAIELGRELPVGAEKRKEIERGQKKNQNKNERLDKILGEHGQRINRDNRLRVELWEELSEDPAGRRCPFSGKIIGIADLFNGETEIEHLIPFSISLDDSRANKVICTREANRDKGQRTPFDAFGSSPSGYNWDEIFERVKDLAKAKQWRFQETALDIWRRDHDDFTSRHLNDTRYIGRLTREYLKNICHIDRIDVLTGRLTALLRGHWGLNGVLQGDNLPEDAQQKKNRDDHRHHAVDAIVIGMTSRSVLQRVASEASKRETNTPNLHRLFPKNEDGHSVIDPWEGFRDDVKEIVRNIVVSHKSGKKTLKNNNMLPGQDSTSGQLHNDTAYGIVSGPDRKGRHEVVTRWMVDRFKSRDHVEAIRDDKLRAEFLHAFDDAVGSGKKGDEGVMSLAKEKGIRHLRRTETLSVIPIKDKSGKIYKAYKSDGNWATEIYEYPAGHEEAGMWEERVITRFTASQKGFRPGVTKRPHPAARLIMRLQKDDCIEIEENGVKRLLRLQVTTPGTLSFAPLNEANVDARDRDKKNKEFSYFRKAPGKLRELKARKVHVSPTGQVSYEKRRKNG